MKLTTKELVIMGLMLALAAVLAQFPINGSIGLDAMPAFFTAAALTPVLGGVVGAIAHLLIAGISGFVLGLPVHIVIAVMMFASCFVYGYVCKSVNRYVAVVAGVVMNGPVSLFVAAFFAKLLGAEFSGMVMFLALVLPLTMTAAINVVLADVIYGIVKDKI